MGEVADSRHVWLTGTISQVSFDLMVQGDRLTMKDFWFDVRIDHKRALRILLMWEILDI